MDWRWLVAPGSFFVIAPMTLLGGALLAGWNRQWRPVLRWWCLFALACILVAASKIAHYAWGTQIAAWELTCFSGHSMLAFAFWPLALALAAPAGARRTRWLLWSLGIGIAALIGLSRVRLGAHPWSEVIAGSLLGLLAGSLAMNGLRRWHFPRPLVLVLVLAAGLLWVGEERNAARTRHCTEPMFALAGAWLAKRPLPPVPCLPW